MRGEAHCRPDPNFDPTTGAGYRRVVLYAGCHKKIDKTKTIWTDASPLAFIHVGDGQWWFTTVVWPHGDKP